MSDTVDVHLFAAARAAVGQSMVTVPAGTLAAVLDALEASAPGFARVRPQCSYLVDGLTVHDDPAGIDVPAGTRLDVLPPFAGG
jgi:molybdopterin synthase sulfur carrier subunit